MKAKAPIEKLKRVLTDRIKNTPGRKNIIITTFSRTKYPGLVAKYLNCSVLLEFKLKENINAKPTKISLDHNDKD